MANNIFGDTSLKVNWEGEIVSIQPRTRVWRYLTDNRIHYLLGYNLFIEGCSSDSDGEKHFTVAISEKQQLKGLFRIGDVIQGTAWTKKYKEREFADYYKAGSLKLLDRANVNIESASPPWIMMVPIMEIYKERGARLLGTIKKIIDQYACLFCLRLCW